MAVDDLLRDITLLSLLDAAELTKQLQARLGIELPRQFASPARVPPPPPLPPPPPPEYVVELSAVGERKVQVMRVLRERTNVGLAEARAMIERTPVVVAVHLARGDAELLRAELVQAGAQVDVKPI